jgi:hypothetical protein
VEEIYILGVRTLTVFLERQFTLFVIVFVLSSPTIFPSLQAAKVSIFLVKPRADSSSKLVCGQTFPLFLGILSVLLDQV